MNSQMPGDREVNPQCILPEDLRASIWRYMDGAKFRWLIEQSALYMCRADRLQDQFEGTYTRQQIERMNEWLTSRDLGQIAEQERIRRDAARQRTFISCWCLSDVDLDLMWKGYVPSGPGVAIKSSISRLKDICDRADVMFPLDLSIVKYIDRIRGEHIDYGGVIEPFICKDVHYRLDNELRIIHWPNLQGQPPDFVRLPVILADLVEAVFISPKAPPKFADEIKNLLGAFGLGGLPLLYSRDISID